VRAGVIAGIPPNSPAVSGNCGSAGPEENSAFAVAPSLCRSIAAVVCGFIAPTSVFCAGEWGKDAGKGEEDEVEEQEEEEEEEEAEDVTEAGLREAVEEGEDGTDVVWVACNGEVHKDVGGHDDVTTKGRSEGVQEGAGIIVGGT
jgi:hypothetical protein